MILSSSVALSSKVPHHTDTYAYSNTHANACTCICSCVSGKCCNNNRSISYHQQPVVNSTTSGTVSTTSTWITVDSSLTQNINNIVTDTINNYDSYLSSVKINPYCNTFNSNSGLNDSTGLNYNYSPSD